MMTAIIIPSAMMKGESHNQNYFVLSFLSKEDEFDFEELFCLLIADS